MMTRSQKLSTKSSIKTPEQFDPQSQSPLPLPLQSEATDSCSAHGCGAGGSSTQAHKSPPLPKGTPSITDNHKQLHHADKKPLEARFFHPKYWGIWLLMLFILPLIYLPLSLQFMIGRGLGKLIYALSANRRRVTLVNLKLAFPEKTTLQHQQMAQEVFINQGIGVFETLCAWFRPNVFTRTLSIEGLHHLVSAQNEGKAVLLLGGHYTMLDLGGRLCTQFFPVDCVYRPQNNDLLEWFIYNGRRHIFGSQIDHKNMRKLVSEIKAGHVIWYSPDQDYGLKQGVMADFFGVPAATITAPRRLSRLGDKSNPPVVMALHTYRETPNKLRWGKRPHYHITITPALDNYPSSDELADAKRVNQLLESLIRIDPTQWMWFHKRYKSGENGRTTYYDS